ncbi:MAG: dihydroorotase family protein [Alphaproteobacteria bacterium]|nr:dihydroorotase family protein [Alphaproteobacteria bacterium]
MYDLIIRDATIVSSAGRQVADVAIKDGKFAYVGPRPPRSAKRELSAIGRFLMPGVIDTAAHVPMDRAAWTLESGAAVTGGVTTILALPTGPAPIVDADSARARDDLLGGASWCDYGLWGLATDTNRDALAQAVEEGLLVAILAILGGEPDCVAPATLEALVNTPGALGVQVLTDDPIELRPDADGDPQGSPEALAVLRAAREHDRAVHWVNLSTTEELDLLDPVRGDLPVTAGVTPHHLFLSEEEDTGVVTRPPVRPEKDRRTLWTALRRGRLDCLASDHRASARGEPGAPSLELLLPLMLSAVRYGKLSLEMLVTLCSESPAKVFGLESKGRIVKGADADLVLFSEGDMGRVDPDDLLSGAGWSPYAGREAAPKPELVMVGGQVVAVRGELVGEKPTGARVSAS